MIELTGDKKTDSAILLPYKLQKIYTGCRINKVDGTTNDELKFTISTIHGMNMLTTLWKWSVDLTMWECTSIESANKSAVEITKLVKETKI